MFSVASEPVIRRGDRHEELNPTTFVHFSAAESRTFATIAGDFEDEFPAAQLLHTVKKALRSYLAVDSSNSLLACRPCVFATARKTSRDGASPDGVRISTRAQPNGTWLVNQP
jgi:hypothetical protein